MKYPVKAIGKHFKLKSADWRDRYVCASFVLPRNCNYPDFGVNFKYSLQGYTEGGSQVCFLTVEDARKFAKDILHDSWAVPYLSTDASSELVQINTNKEYPTYLYAAWCQYYLNQRGDDPQKYPENISKNLKSTAAPVVNAFYKEDKSVVDNRQLVVDYLLNPLKKYFNFNTDLFKQSGGAGVESSIIKTDDISFKIKLIVGATKTAVNVELMIPFEIYLNQKIFGSSILNNYDYAYVQSFKLLDINYDAEKGPKFISKFTPHVLTTPQATGQSKFAGLYMIPELTAAGNKASSTRLIATWGNDRDKCIERIKKLADQILSYVDYIKSSTFRDIVSKYIKDFDDGQEIVKYTF